MAERALVLLSGGIDSAVALWWSLRRKGWDAEALSFQYFERPVQEADAARALAEAAGVPLRVIEVPFLREAAVVPGAAVRRAPEGYVPARNLVFYSIAAGVAESVGASVLVGGHHGRDQDLFPDASPAFFRRFAALARMGVWSFRGSRFRVEQPLLGLDKEGVVKLALELGVPLPLTWSCYADGAVGCGTCASCRERLAAFAAIGAKDPLAYAAP